MILDIEGKEILVGDECYMPWSNKLFKIKIVKETPKSIYYYWARRVNGKWNDYSANPTFSVKSGNPASNIIKIC